MKLINSCIYVYLNVGSVYLFYSSDGVSGWTEMAKLVDLNGAASDSVGISVSMYGNMLAVGAIGVDTYRGDIQKSVYEHVWGCLKEII